MYIFYIIAIIIFLSGAVAWYKSDRIVWWEWLTTGAVGFATAIIFHIAAFSGMTDDVQTLSGRVTEARFIPAWTEQYTYYTTVTGGSGKSKTTIQVPHTGIDIHFKTWTASDSLGSTVSIEKSYYDAIAARFGGGIQATQGCRSSMFRANSHMILGDSHDYIAVNNCNYIEPVNAWVHWTNRIKAAPSVFSFTKLKTVENATVFDYPENADHFASGRILGTAATAIAPYTWDQFNAVVGPTKQVNCILIGFGNQDSSIAEVQRAKWIGGKKNDLVICYGGLNAKPSWVKVFGWSDSEECKYTLQTLVQSEGVSPALLPRLESEITKNYQIKDWTKFDYITIEPPTWSYFVYFLVVALAQGGLWLYFTLNDETKIKRY